MVKSSIKATIKATAKTATKPVSKKTVKFAIKATIKTTKCIRCNNRRWTSPIGSSTENDTYRMETVNVRCPLCFDPEISDEDKDFMLRYYYKESSPWVLERYNIIRAAIKEKYPDWVEQLETAKDKRDLKENAYDKVNRVMYDRITRPVTKPGEHCELCMDMRTVCPGCTGGKIPPRMRMSCGYLQRCAWCVDYDGALQDKEILSFCDRNGDRYDYIQELQDEIVYEAVKEKYPEWEPMH